MAKKHVFGLVAVKLGDPEPDGGMSTNLVEIGETVSGTALMTTTDPTVTDIEIEESDSPIESISKAGKIEFDWSTYNVSGDALARFFGGEVITAGGVSSFGTLTPGSGYGDGTYNNVPLTGGTGSGAKANIVVEGGEVTSVTLVDSGSGYTASDALGAAASDIGGGGTGFSVAAGAISSVSQWGAPDAFPDVEKSVEITDKKGNITRIPRAKISSKLNLTYTKDKIGQVDIKATVLQPNKPGVRRLSIQYA